MSAHFKYSEELIAQEISISRDELKKLRDDRLREGRDWRKKSGTIAYSTSGVAAVCRALETKPSTFDLRRCLLPSYRKNGAATEPIALGYGNKKVPMELVVQKIYPNPFLLRAALPTDPRETFEVRVKTNLVWTVGWKIFAVQSTHVAGYFEEVEPRPKKKGDKKYLAGKA